MYKFSANLGLLWNVFSAEEDIKLFGFDAIEFQYGLKENDVRKHHCYSYLWL